MDGQGSAADEAHQIVRPLVYGRRGSPSERHEQGGVLTVHVGPVKRDKHEDDDGCREPSHIRI